MITLMHDQIVYLMMMEAGLDQKACSDISKGSIYPDLFRPENIEVKPNTDYVPIVCQHYDYRVRIKNVEWDPRTFAWILFHFGGVHAFQSFTPCILGDGWNDVVAAWHAFLAEPSAENAFYFGLMLHIWMDSYSHHNFKGWRANSNQNPHTRGDFWYKVKSLFTSVAPAIGHAEFGSLPDEPWAIWYNQNGRRVVNSQLFTDCMTKLWEMIKPANSLVAPESVRIVADCQSGGVMAAWVQTALNGRNAAHHGHKMPATTSADYNTFTAAVRRYVNFATKGF